MPNDLIRRRDIAPSSLRLPDGRRADDLRLSALYSALVALKITDISPHMGKASLLAAYAHHLIALIDKMPRATAQPWQSTVADVVVQKAIEQVGKDAA